MLKGFRTPQKQQLAASGDGIQEAEGPEEGHRAHGGLWEIEKKGQGGKGKLTWFSWPCCPLSPPWDQEEDTIVGT